MTIYIIVFLASCLCFYAKDRTRGFLAAFLTLIGITIPCLLAAVRDKTIGTDVTGYGMFVYRDTKNVSLLEAFNIRSDNPRGFVALAWLINLANGSFEVYLFIIELLIILPAYFSIEILIEENRQCQADRVLENDRSEDENQSLSENSPELLIA